MLENYVGKILEETLSSATDTRLKVIYFALICVLM